MQTCVYGVYLGAFVCEITQNDNGLEAGLWFKSAFRCFCLENKTNVDQKLTCCYRVLFGLFV